MACEALQLDTWRGVHRCRSVKVRGHKTGAVHQHDFVSELEMLRAMASSSNTRAGHRLTVLEISAFIP